MEAISHSTVVERIVEQLVDFEFPYVMMNSVMRIIKEMQPRIVNQTFDNTCNITLAIKKTEADLLKKRLEHLAFE